MSIDAPTIITFIATLALFVACVIIHYEGLHAFACWDAFKWKIPRVRIAILICGQFILHFIEICIFAAGLILLVEYFGYGALVNVVCDADPRFNLTTFADYVYYSSFAYTTLGIGEIIPIGPVRFLTGMEAVGGLLLITWSASFTYIEMRRYWGRA